MVHLLIYTYIYIYVSHSLIYVHDDTFVDKAGGFVDHVHSVSPARSSGTDAVDAL